MSRIPIEEVQYYALVKAIEKRKVSQIVGGVTTYDIIPAFGWIGRRNWSAPSYRIDAVLNNLPYEERSRLVMKGRELIKEGNLKMPHQAFAIIYNTVPRNMPAVTFIGESRHDIGIDIAWNNENPEIERAFWADTFILSGRDSEQKIWLRGLLTLSPPGPGVFAYDLQEKSVYHEPSSLDYENASLFRDNAILMIMLLGSEGRDYMIKIGEPEITSKLKMFNNNRPAKSGRAIPGTRRILDIDLECIRKVRWTDPSRMGSGSPRAGHMRRGHWRRLDADRRIWIPEMAIKGGPTDTPPTRTVRLTSQA